MKTDPIFGGGVTAAKRYSKGESSVEITIASDSPMLQATMMLFANPMFATADGAKMETIKGQKTIVRSSNENKGGEMQIVVNNRFLVSVNGSNVPKEEMLNYIKAFDFAKLAEIK